MAPTDPSDWMFSEALNALFRAERLHGQHFRIRPSGETSEPRWEPPVDMLETAREVLVFVSLPGVDPDQVDAVIEDSALVVSGRRALPDELRDAVIHRLELPQGRFERRIALPTGRYSSVRRFARNGCVVFSLVKLP